MERNRSTEPGRPAAIDRPTRGDRATDRVARDLRLLKAYAIGSSIAIVTLLLGAFASDRTNRFDVLEAERINVRHPDGELALAIAGTGGLPGPTFEGREYPQELSGGRTRASGMIFFNERGDEVGGLTYSGRLEGDGYRAGGGITFDQFRQDQVVSLQYQDDGENRRAGVHVWDRSDEISIARILDVVDARARATGAARDSLDRIVAGWRDAGLAAHRIFLGSADRTATLLMSDREGRPRIRLYVDSANVARLEFLDSAGAVVHSLPE